jgi:nucleotide-binding universal stress UspA family protein
LPDSLKKLGEERRTGIQVLPGVSSELTCTLNGYRKYLLEKTRKFMNNAKTSAARHGIDFEEKIITSNDTVNAIANFTKLEEFEIIVIGDRVKRGISKI